MEDFRNNQLLSGVTDDDLVKAAAESAEAYSELISRYLPSIRGLARIYTKASADRDDLVSEGILGLMNAVKTYRSDKGASFSTYAGVCVNRRMLTALKKSAAISRREEPLEDTAIQTGASPEKIVIDREALREVFSEISQSFSQRERQVFLRYLSGESYDAIAKALGTDRKSVGNALARVRLKLRRKFR